MTVFSAHLHEAWLARQLECGEKVTSCGEVRLSSETGRLAATATATLGSQEQLKASPTAPHTFALYNLEDCTEVQSTRYTMHTK